ncbi:hypothetical protein Anapl_08940, partial [Anas platyrhynchos]
ARHSRVTTQGSSLTGSRLWKHFCILGNVCTTLSIFTVL